MRRTTITRERKKNAQAGAENANVIQEGWLPDSNAGPLHCEADMLIVHRAALSTALKHKIKHD